MPKLKRKSFNPSLKTQLRNLVKTYSYLSSINAEPKVLNFYSNEIDRVESEIEKQKVADEKINKFLSNVKVTNPAFV